MHGPAIILDKSTLQCLSKNDIHTLTTVFTANIPPVLISEILADLKNPKPMSEPKKDVKILADKVLDLFNFSVNMEFELMAKGELFGHELEMRNVPVLDGGKRVKLPTGGFAVMFDEHPARPVLRRWSQEEFLPQEELFAEDWRTTNQKPEVENLIRKFKQFRRNIPKAADLKELADRIDTYLEGKGWQFQFLASMMRFLGVGLHDKMAVASRWRVGGHANLKSFAPYTFHILRVNMIYAFGVLSDLIGTRATNKIDLEYLYYSPFCFAFSSGDRFLEAMSKHVIQPSQFFIGRDTLKTDMKAIQACRDVAESERDKLLDALRSGPNPPFSHPVWNQIAKPWERIDYKRRRQSDVEPKAFEKVMAEFRYVQEAIVRGEYY
jgi:hypothetical protein